VLIFDFSLFINLFNYLQLRNAFVCLAKIFKLTIYFTVRRTMIFSRFALNTLL